MACDGTIETWLPKLMTAIKDALHFQVLTALGLEKPLPPPAPAKTRPIGSAGARKIQMPDRRPATKQSKNTSFISSVAIINSLLGALQYIWLTHMSVR